MKTTKLLSLALLTIGVAACSSCANKTPVPETPSASPSPSAPEPVPTNSLKMSQDNWEFTLPTEGWEKVLDVPPGITLALLNRDKKNMIIFVSEKFSGKYEEYVISALRGVKSAGAAVTSAKQMVLNGVPFVLIESSKDGVTLWLWVTLVNEQGYGFSCGGQTTDSSQYELCLGVANTVKLK